MGMEVPNVEVLLEVARRLRDQQSFALVTLTKASGSTPRKEGARMIVSPQGEIVGSVGGAAVERIAVEEAKKAIQSGQIATIKLNLNDLEGEETGMICGGWVELLIEPFGTTPQLHLFGAGHVAQPTAFLAGKLGFRITIYDPRAEWANPDRFPHCRIELGVCHELAKTLQTTSQDFIVIMTHCHSEDYKVLTQVIGKPWFYLGVIGSRKKAIEIKQKLREEGVGPELIDRICLPIGIPNLATHTPWEIAISVAAQLIEKWGELNVRRTSSLRTSQPDAEILNQAIASSS